MKEELPQLSDYVVTVRRRKLWALGVFTIAVLASLYMAFGVAPTYRSDATILIEGQEIPEDFVQSTVTGYADERIQVIGQRVMTRGNLISLIERHNLFPEERDGTPIEVIAARMRDAIFLETVQINVLDQSRGRSYPVTIAFNIAFEYFSPEVTYDVATELSELFLLENARNRTELASETSIFLDAEANDLLEEISALETKMAAFKQENRNTMPELSELNMQLMERTEDELDQIERDIRGLREQRELLLAQLSTTSTTTPLVSTAGEAILTAEERLSYLQSQYLSLSSVYSADHPDLVRIEREIRSLTGGSSPVSSSALSTELTAREAELSETRQRYSPSHPDVRRLEAIVTDLRSRLAASLEGPQNNVSTPTNPVYIQLRVQLDGVNRELTALGAQARDLRAEAIDYRERLVTTPQIEREWLSLTREYDLAVAKYQEIRSQLTAATRAVSLEASQKGERFTLIDPPRVSSEPVRPNRPITLFVGMIFALTGSAAIIALLEALDGTVRSSTDVRSLIDAPPLAVIPYVQNSRDKSLLRLKRLAVGAAFGCAGIAAAIIVT